MAGHNHDPSSSLEGNRLTRRGVLAGVVGGATMLIVGCGKDRMAVPPDYSTQSASPSESPSTSPSPTETIDPKRAAREKYEGVRKQFEHLTPEQFANLPRKKREEVYRNERRFAQELGHLENPNNTRYNPRKGVRPGEHCLTPPSMDNTPEEVMAIWGSTIAAACDASSWNPDYARKIASSAYYGDPELRKSVLDERLAKGEISSSEYGVKQIAVTLVEAMAERQKSGSKVPGSEMPLLLNPRFGKAESFVDPETGEILPTLGLQFFTEAPITGSLTGVVARLVIKDELWQAVDQEVSNLKGANP